MEIGERLWAYLYAIQIYWLVAISVMFTAERITERTFPNFWKSKIDPWFTAVWRRRILIIGASLFFVYANFRAFDDLQTRNNELTNKINDRSEEQAKQERETEQHKRSTDALYELIRKGNAIHDAFARDHNTERLINDYNSWVFSAEFTLENTLGPAYTTQFNSAPQSLATFAGQDPDSTGTWQTLNGKLAELHEMQRDLLSNK